MSGYLLDTSVFVASESGRPIQAMPADGPAYVSAVTVAELTAGVLAAKDVGARATRLAMLAAAEETEPLVVDARAARHWAEMRVRLAEAGRRANVNDLWIAAVALANGLTVVTQDDDFDVLADCGGPEVIRV